MEELFELIKAVNRLKEKIIEMIGKIDLLLKTTVADGRDARGCVSDKNPGRCVSDKDAPPCVSTADGYVEEEGACRILHICPRTLAKMRAEGSIPYIKSRKKILYKATDLNEFMQQTGSQTFK